MPASPPLPLAPEPALQTAARLLAEGRPDQAAGRLAALLADAPTYAAAHVLHATALEAAGRAADALQAWSHAAFLVPRSPLVQRERQRLAALFVPAEPEAAVPEEPWTEAAPEPAETPTLDALVGGSGDPFGGADHDLGAPDHDLGAPDHDLGASDRPLGDADQPLDPSDRHPGLPDRHLGEADRDLGVSDRPLGGADSDLGEANRDLGGADRDLGEADRALGDADGELGDADTPRLFDEPFLEGLPLESLTTLFETDTPLFVEDDDEPLAEAMDEPVDAPPVADWGDLPPVGAPLLPPDAPEPSTHTEADAPPQEPDDWRVIETVDDDAPPTVAPTSFAAPEAAPEPEAPAEREPFAVPADDLDALISSLEQAPRIRPDPAFSAPAVTVDESSVDEMVSETLAQIYAAQHRYVEAAVMYEKLAAREPSRADAMLQRAAELRDRR